MDDEIGLGDLINQFIGYNLEGINTAIPAVILGVKQEGRDLLIDVQPSVSVKTREGDVISQASILNVPMYQPASSVGGMLFPVQKGDNVLLIFTQRAIDTWKYGTGGLAPPSDYRKFSKLDCIALPCVFPTANSMANPKKQGKDYELGDVVIYNARNTSSPVEIVIKKNGNVIVNSPAKVQVNCVDAEVNASSSIKNVTPNFSVQCSQYTVNTSTATLTGNWNLSGSFVLNGIAMETHGHIEQGDGNRVSNPVS